ncbi:hypothetical protein [Paraburkholderia kururiensis]|uniref:hypothetical protein n=1 Tax=Paraburkholderia kururiensis TaxID=984307 RepID=UPI0018F4F3DB|nr:hypothetical protein [Paraburkholderia kururiensis]
MLRAEQQARARRWIEGRGSFEDLDRLYLDLRQASQGHDSFRELGDFLAHRDDRTKGPVTQRVRDVFTSFRVWSSGLRGETPNLDDFRACGLANLRLLNEDDIKARCGTHREAASRKLDKLFRKLENGHPGSDSDRRLWSALVNRFVWKPAFTDEEVHRDFLAVLRKNDVLTLEAELLPVQAANLLSLHALVRLHGARVRLEDGRVCSLYAGYSNPEQHLEIKVDLSSGDWPKPVQAPVCMFLTRLRCDDHCGESLLVQGRKPLWNDWMDPIELGVDGKLRRLT